MGLILWGDYSQFSNEKRRAAMGALAGVLEISIEGIKILTTAAGSIVLNLEMPIRSAIKLLDWHQRNDSRNKSLIRDYPINEVKVRSEYLDVKIIELQS